MRPRDIKQALIDLLPTHQPVFLIGPPGVGKSSLFRQAAATLFNGEDWRSTVTLAGTADPPWYRQTDVLTIDPVDGRGLPEISGKGTDRCTTWVTPDLVPTTGQGVWVIEELPLATPSLQAMFRSPLLDRSLCGRRMGEGWTCGATGNRAQDRAGAKNLLSHVIGAMTVLEVEPDHRDTMDWMFRAGVHPDVRAFLQWKPAAFWDFDPARQINTDPRGWERVGIVLPKLSKHLRLPVFSGMIEQGHAAEFIGWLNLKDNLPDLDAMLAKADSHPMPSEPSILFALSSAIGQRAIKANPKELNAIATLSARMPVEFGVRTMLDCGAARDDDGAALFRTPAGQAWIKIPSNRQAVLGAGWGQK